RVYFTSSLLANWDKKDAANEQFLKAYTWDGKRLTPAFAIDFYKENLGRPHIMHFGQGQFYKNQIFAEQKTEASGTSVADARRDARARRSTMLVNCREGARITNASRFNVWLKP